MQPDLEVVQVGADRSFKIWSHGYPYPTVRWHFHPEYELHLVTTTSGNRYVGDHIGPFEPGDLVLTGPNLPHNWISLIAPGELVTERCLVLQFTESLISDCIATFPELRFLRHILGESLRGVRFGPALAARIEPVLRRLLAAGGASRLAHFAEILDLIGNDDDHTALTSLRFLPDPSSYMSATMNAVLQHIGRNLTSELVEAELAAMNRQSVSSFCRSFRKHTGATFVQYVNAMRIELACQHLTLDDLSVTEICYEVGFNNVSNFNRQFLANKGMPPSRFRDLYRRGTRLASAA